MNKETIHRIRLGIFVVTAIVMLIVGMYFIGNNQNMFGSTFNVYSTFHDVNGLQPGNNVRYSGIDVGTVKSIEIKNDTSVHVEMVIEIKMKNFIRKNSLATIGTDGLMGNKLVNITPGTMDAPLINEGDEFPSEESVNTEAMLRTLEFTNQNIGFVSANLKEITENINKSRGTLYTVLMDTTLANKFHTTITHIESISRHLTEITGDLSSITGDVKKGKGLVGAILKDTSMTNDLKTIMTEIKKSSEQFSSLTNEVGQMVNRLDKGNGTISKLLNDSSMANDLKQSITNIQTSSQKLDENLEALKHNFLFRGYFRDQEKLKKK